MISQAIKSKHNFNLIAQFQNGHKCLLRYLYVAYLAHSFLAFLLLLQQFALAAYVASVALGGYVFAQGTYAFSGYYFGADGGLYHNLELLAR